MPLPLSRLTLPANKSTDIIFIDALWGGHLDSLRCFVDMVVCLVCLVCVPGFWILISEFGSTPSRPLYHKKSQIAHLSNSNTMTRCRPPTALEAPSISKNYYKTPYLLTKPSTLSCNRKQVIARRIQVLHTTFKK